MSLEHLCATCRAARAHARRASDHSCQPAAASSAFRRLQSSPDSMVPLTFSYSRLYEYPMHAVLQYSGLSRNVGTLENGLFRLPSSSDFLSLGSFGLDLRIYRTSALLFYSFRIRHFRIRYIWYINFFGYIG